jgi:hypothetical protein
MCSSLLLSTVRTLAGDVEAFGNQVAGHKKEGKSIMKQGDKIYKPFSLREFEFYEYLKTWDNPPRFFPKYFGRTQIPGEGDTVNRTPLFKIRFSIFRFHQ